MNGRQGEQGPEGPAGPIGLRGKPGRSAFEEAVAQGFIGTVDAWLASMRGESVFDIAKRNGFEGSEQDFIDRMFEKVVTAKKPDDEQYEVIDPDVAPYVRYDAPQSLSKDEQAQARENINAFCNDEAIIWESVDIAEKLVDDWDTAVLYIPQTLTAQQQKQARINIGVADEYRVQRLEDSFEKLNGGDVINIGDVNVLLQNIKDDIYNRGEDLLVVNAINTVDRIAVLNQTNIGDMDKLLDPDAMEAMQNVSVDTITTLVDAINKLANLCYEALDIDFNNDITW